MNLFTLVNKKRYPYIYNLLGTKFVIYLIEKIQKEYQENDTGLLKHIFGNQDQFSDVLSAAS